jgi:hypothetical protein
LKIIEAINAVDLRKPGNPYSTEDKVAWLANLDGQIKMQVMDLCEGDHFDFTPYNSDTDIEMQLLVPHPFDEIYVSWLCACVDLANGDYDAYQNSAGHYNAQYSAFQAYYIRTHRPKSCGRQFF